MEIVCNVMMICDIHTAQFNLAKFNIQLQFRINKKSLYQKIKLSLTFVIIILVQHMEARAYPEDITCVVHSNDQNGSIYVGNLQAAQNLVTLKKHKIKSVLTSCSGIFLCHPKSDVPYYLYVPGQDHETFDISRYFNQAALFIKESVDKTNIMVHCMAGISRSVALVIAYLIKYKQISTDEALALIKCKRNIAQPNKGFISQLKKFEGQLKLTKIKMQSIFSIPNLTEKVEISGQKRENQKYSFNYESMNKSTLHEIQQSISRFQDSSMRNSRRNNIQTKYTFESIQPVEYSRLERNLNEISIEIETRKKNRNSYKKSGNSQKKSNLKSSLKFSRKSAIHNSLKPKKKVTFNLNPQYFEIQSSQQAQETPKKDYSRQGKYQYTRILEASRTYLEQKTDMKTNKYSEIRITNFQYPRTTDIQYTYSRQKVDVKIDKYSGIRANNFQQQKTRTAYEYQYTSYIKPSPSQMSQIDKKIQAITKKYDQHLYQTNKRALTNNFLNTDPVTENQTGKNKLNYFFERQKSEQIKAPKFSDIERKIQFQRKQNMNGSTVYQQRRSSDLGLQYKNRTVDQNLLSGNRTIDRILQRKIKQGNAGSIRKNSTRYANSINFNY